MEIFPCPTFWDHVLILRTHSLIGPKFEKMKDRIKGKLVEGINNDHDLVDFMRKYNINKPDNLKEYFVDSDPEDLGQDTLDEFSNILKHMSNIYPIYKEVKEEIKEEANEEKEGNLTIIHIKVDKHIKFKDFDDQEHQVVQTTHERYNLNGIKPLLVEAKREQAKNPRGPFCWKNQFKTRYYLLKYYEIKGDRKRVESEIEYRWEPKDTEKREIEGEKYRKTLIRKYSNNKA